MRDILANPKSPPGQGFEYSNATSHLLAAIVAHATGTTPLEYARERLFGPLGIDTTPAWTEEIGRGNLDAYEKADFAWPTDPQGINTGFGAIKLRPRDMVKLGQLFLDGGRWEGKQIVPEEWVDEATTQQIESTGRTSATATSGGPGSWTASMSFQALGYGGQADRRRTQPRPRGGHHDRAAANDVDSHGIDNGVLHAIIEDGVVSHSHPQTDPIAER